MKKQEIFTAIEQSFGSIQEFHKFESDNRFEMEINYLTVYSEPCVQLIFWSENGDYIDYTQTEDHTKWLNSVHPDWLKELCLTVLNENAIFLLECRNRQTTQT